MPGDVIIEPSGEALRTFTIPRSGKNLIVTIETSERCYKFTWSELREVDIHIHADENVIVGEIVEGEGW